MITLEDLLEIDKRRFYRIIYCCSQYGNTYDSKKEAEEVWENVVSLHGPFEHSPYIDELTGWQEEFNCDCTAVDYIEAAMREIKRLQGELKESQHLVDSLMDENDYLEDRIRDDMLERKFYDR